MKLLKRIGGWIVALILWLWTILPKSLDWVGRSTLPEDWEQLMAEKLPIWAAWLFATPWWVPAVLATALTLWMMWVSRPRKSVAEFAAPITDNVQYTPWYDGKATFIELHLTIDEFRCKEVISENVYDFAVSMLGNDPTQLEILVVFDKWIVSRNAAITCDNRLENYHTSVQKMTDRYVLCQVRNVGSPAVIRVDCN
jgi:hypothetical protein